MKHVIARLVCETEGQDLIEYGLLAAFISIAAIVMIKAIGPLIATQFTSVQTALTP